MKTYTPEFKVMVVKEAIESGCTLRILVEKYDIGGESTLRDWIKLYKERGESYFFRNQPQKNEQAALNISEDTTAKELAVEDGLTAEEAIINKEDVNGSLAKEETKKGEIAKNQLADAENIKSPEPNISFKAKSLFNEKLKGAANVIKTKATSVGSIIARGAKSGSKSLSQSLKTLNPTQYLPKKEKKEKKEK